MNATHKRTTNCGTTKKMGGGMCAHKHVALRSAASSRRTKYLFLSPSPSPSHHRRHPKLKRGQPFVRATQQDGEQADTVDVKPVANGQSDGDVYFVEHKPLSEGVKKHTLLVFVSDESGIINRVSGVFSRRGFNIESLAVGLNVDKALFTIVLNATQTSVNNLVKQITKLVKVKYVEDVTYQDRVERELMLIKVRCPAGAARTEVLQLSEIFRAKVVDVSDESVTLCATGDPGKTVALQKLLSKFGVTEVARTGKIALQRGETTIQGNSWDKKKGAGEDVSSGERSKGDISQAVAEESTPESEEAGDVYMLDSDIGPGIWSIGYMPEQMNTEGEEDLDRHTMSLLVADEPGVLQQVTSVFARRGYNIQSLAVGHAEEKGWSRISLVVPGTPDSIDNLQKQLLKLVYVRKVHDLTNEPFVSRELMLIKCRCKTKERKDILDVAEIFRCNICDISRNTITLEMQGRWDKMTALQKILEPYHILEVARTGRIALSRESGVDTKYLEQIENTNLASRSSMSD